MAGGVNAAGRPGAGGGHGAVAGHDAAAGHPSHLAHHFDTPGQQFQAGKTGMWLFLSAELLFFGGLFCAYAVYRHNHPEIFVYADQFLDKTLGGINTLVLIFSSFTAAWAVRAAQLGQRRLLIGLIVTTLVCACVFLCIKGVEYEAKWKHGLLWGERFNPGKGHLGIELPGAKDVPATGVAGSKTTNEPAPVPGAPAPGAPGQGAPGQGVPVQAPKTPAAGTPGPASASPASVPTPAAAASAGPLDIHTNLKPAGVAPPGLAGSIDEEGRHRPGADHTPGERPQNVQVFFSIYFAMTGLHAIHVIAGIIAWLWILGRAVRGEFSGAYFIPVDLTALYWHLVDLIWIYLFPLLYLIH